MALRYAFFLFVVFHAINPASGFSLKKPVHIYPKTHPLEKSLSHRILHRDRVNPGEDAAPGQFPYQILLFCQVSNVSGFLCGGSIIAEDWILTAGHCVEDYENDPGNFFLTAGAINSNGAGGQELQGRLVIQHEGYSALTTEHDIAVIQTEGSYTFNNNVCKICVPPAGYAASGEAVISGFGSPAGSTATTLQYATVTIISDSACQDIYGTSAVRDNDICTGPGPTGQTSCNALSGGPLAVDGRVVGILSRNPSCNNYNASIYTETSYYTDWIATNTGIGSC